VHNESYSYILSSVVSLDKQNEAFEIGRKDPVLLKRNEKLMEQYNAFARQPDVEDIVKTLVYSTLLEGLFF
ncbi:ribonucleotide-diphosphate reductase subunit beta, partial [Streptococcus parasanguinis]